jgi:CheY-like chemotaxis protein
MHEPKTRVLVVDDNIDAAETLSLLLRLQGYHVAMAHDGASALKQASELPPDIVLLDIGLPGIDGFEVARLLRQRGFSKTTLVAVTGYSGADDVQQALEAGFDHHVVKPVPFELLKELIGQARAGGQARAPAPSR